MAITPELRIPLKIIENSVLNSLNRIEKIRTTFLDKIEVMVEIVGIQENIHKIKKALVKAVELTIDKKMTKIIKSLNVANRLANEIILRIGPLEGEAFAKELVVLEKRFIEMTNNLKETYKN
ncbi:MAG: hypothetical protein Q8R00_03605 [Candidatus Nanoarchaeia archaeon]|nr:hypothetical protein [Candidatus Nanoarchaeia archaeon]